MPKSVPQAEFDAICDVVSRFSDGVSVDEIHNQLPVPMPRRTLQRRLARLVQENQLVIEGAGRGSRYHLPSAGGTARSMQNKAIKRNEALAVLSRLKPELVKRFGVTRLALFGSTARNEAGPDSDIDIIVAFDKPATSERYFGMQFLLEDELGHAVDLVTDKAMRPELRPYIEREAINV